ncbi:MAG: 30S ribosome-binding factor RbfA [Bacteroidota bacterium]
MSIRSEKVASTIKKVLALPIEEIAREENAGLVTVTSVKVSSDLQIAKIYLSMFGENISPFEFLKTLENRKGELRSMIGSQMRLRFTPDLRFFFDDTLDQMEHIKNLLDSVKKDNRDDN